MAAYSYKEPCSFFICMGMILIFIFSTHVDGSIVGSTHMRIKCLKISPLEFILSLRNVEDMLYEVKSILQFELSNVNDSDDFLLLSNAISTCSKLLDMSVEEVNWCVSAIKSSKEKYNGTGNLSSDLRTWLSAIHADTDTCMDQFEGTNGKIKDKIATKIFNVDSLVYNLLTKVEPTISNHYAKHGQFPSWVDPRDEQLLEMDVKDIFDVVVAADGTGNFTKVMDAMNASPDSSKKPYVIFIKKGIYNENVEVNKNLVMIGEGMNATIITSNLSNGKNNLSTFNTATFGTIGLGLFIARDISFLNTAGPLGYQAVALRSGCDRSVFYRCEISGYQDSLYAYNMRQFYRDCKISGTVDFIFGYAAAVFQNCTILVRKGLPRQSNTITAQGGKHGINVYGFSFQFCNISANSDLLPFVNSTSTFLGRPWKPYSTTIFMQSFISNVLSAKGWLEWNHSQYLDTLYYAEYKNYGPGAGTQNRVKWQRYHVLHDSREAINFTVAKFIMGDLWLRSTGVPYTPGFGDLA